MNALLEENEPFEEYPIFIKFDSNINRCSLSKLARTLYENSLSSVDDNDQVNDIYIIEPFSIKVSKENIDDLTGLNISLSIGKSDLAFSGVFYKKKSGKYVFFGLPKFKSFDEFNSFPGVNAADIPGHLFFIDILNSWENRTSYRLDYSEILNKLNENILIAEKNGGKIIYSNNNSKINLDINIVQNLSIFDIIDEKKNLVESKINNLFNGSDSSYDEINVFLKIKNKRSNYSLRIQKFNIPGNPESILIIAIDQSKQMQEITLENQLMQLDTMSKMSSSLAHELNQPLNSVKMGISNIKRRIAISHNNGNIDIQEINDRLSRIDSQVSRAAEIIDNIRHFGRKDIETKTFKVNDVIESVEKFIRESFRLSKIELDIIITDKELYVHGQFIKLEQVLFNIIENSKYQILTQKNPVINRVVLRLWRADPNQVMISIEDTGGGIPEDLLHQVFDPFFTTKDEGEGTGLGLSISREIIQEMSGQIEINNVNIPVRGAKVTIALPQIEMAGR